MASHETCAPLATRLGMTLVELLVVIMIMLMVTSAAIPVVSPAMENRRNREAARIVNTFFNSARNRAVETGRPAGVWIERMPGLPEASVQLSFAEVPVAYTGDFIDSTVETFVWPPEYHSNVWRDHFNIVVPKTRHYRNIDTWSSPDSEEQTLVQPGDYIRIAYQGRNYRLHRVHVDAFINTSPQIPPVDASLSPGPWYWHIAHGKNRDGDYNGLLATGYSNRRRNDRTFIIRWFYETHTTLYPLVIPRRNDKTNPLYFQPEMVRGYPYQIIRRPVKLASGGVQLPDEAVIDLNFSGVSGVTVPGNANDPGVPFHPRFHPADTVTRNPYRGEAVFPDDSTPVIVMFSPAGNVENVYRWVPDTNRTNWVWMDDKPFGPLYFLVGKREKVPARTGFAAAALGSVPALNHRAATDQYQNNWLDLNSLWITINPITGLVTTTELSDFADPQERLSLDPANVAKTRAFAIRSMMVGGR